MQLWADSGRDLLARQESQGKVADSYPMKIWCDGLYLDTSSCGSWAPVLGSIRWLECQDAVVKRLCTDLVDLDRRERKL